MDPSLALRLAFTDLDPLGVAGMFGEADVIELIKILQDLRERFAA